MPLNLNDLRSFIIEATQHGYAGLGESGKKTEPDGSKSFSLTRGQWKFHDNYFGGEPFGGRTVIFFKSKPVWMMVYYGSVGKDITNFAKIYEILRKALLQAPEKYPYRGPEKYAEDGFEYQNSWVGEVDNFSGAEAIMHGDVEIYRAKYLGGLVNVRED